MKDIVLSEELHKEGISLIAAPSLKNFRECSASEQARAISKTRGVLLHVKSYEIDEGIARELARGKGVLLFSFSDLLCESGFRRAIVLSKMRLALAVCRKNSAGFAVCTLAQNENGLRTARELSAFMHVLGMDSHERRHAEDAIERAALAHGGKTQCIGEW